MSKNELIAEWRKLNEIENQTNAEFVRTSELQYELENEHDWDVWANTVRVRGYCGLPDGTLMLVFEVEFEAEQSRSRDWISNRAMALYEGDFRWMGREYVTEIERA